MKTFSRGVNSIRKHVMAKNTLKNALEDSSIHPEAVAVELCRTMDKEQLIVIMKYLISHLKNSTK